MVSQTVVVVCFKLQSNKPPTIIHKKACLQMFRYGLARASGSKGKDGPGEWWLVFRQNLHAGCSYQQCLAIPTKWRSVFKVCSSKKAAAIVLVSLLVLV